jgi:2'-5' RNA ligase
MSHAAALRDVEEVRDHWWPRPGWRPGRLFHTWHLTFGGADELHRLVQEYQSALTTAPGLNPVPVEWLHLTMQGVGYGDEVSTDDLDRVVTAVRARLRSIPAFDVTFHRPVVLGEAIALPPAPAQPVHDLRDALRQGIADALGEDSVHAGPEQARGFRPHVSLAYINASGLAAPYVSALSAVEPAPATVRVAEVALIKLDRLLAPDWLYRWTTRAVVPISAL